MYQQNGEKDVQLARLRKGTRKTVVGKVFCKILNDCLVLQLDKSGKIHKRQSGFRAGRSCIDNTFTLNELIQGCLKEGKKEFAFFLNIQKAYDSVWCNGLWLKLWNMGVKGKMWRVSNYTYLGVNFPLQLSFGCTH